jgi:hypothetical protein
MNAGSIAWSAIARNDFEIIFIIIGESCYVYKVEQFLNQILLVDGVFPKPICCFFFETIILAKSVVGKNFSVVELWTIHPNIFERLSRSGWLIENNVLA